MKASGKRLLAIGFLGVALYLAPLSVSTAGAAPAMDDERMSQMMKMMADMQTQMRDMQGRMQGSGPMHGQMGHMMGQMGQMRGMMEQHRRQMMEHCPGSSTPSTPTK